MQGAADGPPSAACSCPVRKETGFDRRLLPAALVLVLAVAAVYGQTYRHEFIAFDDDTYILNNRQITGGLSWEGFVWAFGFHAGNWHPLTWLSHMLDCQLFGLWAGGHHLVGAGIHAANAVLLLVVLTAMTGAFWRSAALAALFAVHPLRVESVAWAAERKDVLAALFWLLTTGAYLRYTRRPGASRYLLSVGLFALGLSAKPMLVTLPFVLLLLDAWPLGRAHPATVRVLPRTVFAGSRPWRALILEKLPFFALSLISSLVTLRSQTLNVIPMVTPDLATRLANAAVSYGRYLETFVWPESLAFLYPYPQAGIAVQAVVASVAALAIISAGVAYCGRRLPYLPVGWLWYLGTLVPVIGLMQVGGQARSDRYTYLPMIGVALALIWLAGDLWPRRTGARRVLAAGSAVSLVLLAVSSAAYVHVWRDSLSLFEYTVGVTRDNYLILNNLGTELIARDRDEEALRVLQDVARIAPKHCNAHYNLGVTLIRRVRYREAVESLSRSLLCYEQGGHVGSYIADTHYNLGIAQAALGHFPEAEWHFRTLLRIMPNYPRGRIALGEVLARRGKALPGHQGDRP